MFVDEDTAAVAFASSWRSKRQLNETSTQTKDLNTSESAVQSTRRKDKEIQTDADLTTLTLGEAGCPGLAEFLLKWEPHVSKLLKKNLRSQAFDGYTVRWEDDASTICQLHSLTNATFNNELQVTGISWNATGAVIAASYGRFDHEDWCTHKAGLCTWNLDRSHLNVTKPDVTIDISCCLMSVCCHPLKPSMIAGGTFNGEVLVWDTSLSGDLLVASSGLGDDSHREPVNRLAWISDPLHKDSNRQLLSIGADGKMLVWKINTRTQKLEIVQGFLMSKDAHSGSVSNKEIGHTSLAVSRDDNSWFLVGCESGGIFKCSLTEIGRLCQNFSNKSTVELHLPVTLGFSSHHGPVYSLDCSPYHRNLFLSCSTDKSLRVFSLLQTTPILTMELDLGYLYSAKWSPVRPLVFAVTTESGHLVVYDLKQNLFQPVLKLDASSEQKPLLSLEFNPKRQNIIATGDDAGFIQVWRLNDELCSQLPNEEEQLDGIANITLE